MIPLLMIAPGFACGKKKNVTQKPRKSQKGSPAANKDVVTQISRITQIIIGSGWAEMRLSQRLTPVLPHHAVAHKTRIGKTTGDVLNKLTIVVFSVFIYVIIRFDRDTVRMFEKC